MKSLNVIFVLFILITSSAFSQRERFRDDNMKAKFEQLEKIKLIEALEMNEETTLRFFARRSEHQKQQQELQQNLDKKNENLDVLFKSGRAATTEELKSSINEITALHTEIENNRMKFINSLSDILTYEQIGKYLIFERKFKDEVRRLLIKERKPPVDND